MKWMSESRWRTLAIVLLSVAGGIGAIFVLQQIMSELPFDYDIYMQGARMIRAGADPYAVLPFWYPFPIVLFTIVPWSFLPDPFVWAFATIPLGLLHLRYGRRTVLLWVFFPLLINVAHAQAEGWLVLPLIWLLEDAPFKASFGIIALMFKPAYALLLAPYRIIGWVRGRRWRELACLGGLTVITFGGAFLVNPGWPLQWWSAILRRSDNTELFERNMTIWAFTNRGGLWWVPLALLLAALVLLAIPLIRSKEGRAAILLGSSLFIFPNGLNPVSSMMVMPLAKSTPEILTLVGVSWVVAGLEVVIGGFGGLYLVIVLVALALTARRLVTAVVTR